jgi:hypothetical protein
VAGICDWECINNDRSPEPEVHRLHYNEEDPVLFCLSKQLQTSSPLHWKCDLEAVGGFDESLPCSQERDLHLRLVCNGIRFVYLPEALYRVMRRRNSVSDDYRNVLLQHGRIFERAFRNLKVKGELTDQRAYWFAKAVAKDGRHCMQHSLTSTAKEYFRLSKSMHRDGILHAFGRRELRVVARLVGPAVAESLCQIALRLGVRV